MLPLLYTHIRLTSASEIIAFADALTFGRSAGVPTPAYFAGCPIPASFVQSLWIGPTSTHAQADLMYTSVWPLTHIERIFHVCTSLRALAIINLYSDQWMILESWVPRTVESLFLGPIHGLVELRALPCYSRLQSFTSLDTVMSNCETSDVLNSGTLRRFRRIYTNGVNAHLGFDQLSCIGPKAKKLEQVEIVCCAPSVEEATELLRSLAIRFAANCDDDRIFLVPRRNTWDSRRDGIRVLFEDWQAGYGLC